MSARHALLVSTLLLLGACTGAPSTVDDGGGPASAAHDAGGLFPDGGDPEGDGGDGPGGADAGDDARDGGTTLHDGGTTPHDGGALADGGPVIDDDAGAPPLDDGGAIVDGGSAGDGGTGDAGPVPGDLDVEWIHGAANCNSSSDPPLQVHLYQEGTYILRQSKCVNYEGPFLYLLLGSERALLIDTGATSSASLFPVRQTIEDLITAHLDGRARADYPLVVAHTHGHGDHKAGDGQFAGQTATTVVGTSQSAVAAFFGFTSWPEDQTTFDLGDRVLDVIPIPGHEQSHVAFYDRHTGLLLTGDSLYPGFIFISQWNTYRASVSRLAVFAASVPVTWVLGTHVEMTSTPGQAYPYGTTYQPNEHTLELTAEHLFELDAALEALGSSATSQVHDDFIISP